MARKAGTIDVETTEAMTANEPSTSAVNAPPAPGVGTPTTSPLAGLPPAAAQHIEKLTAMVMEMYQVLQQFIPVVIQKIDALEQSVGMPGGAPAPVGTEDEMAESEGPSMV